MEHSRNKQSISFKWHAVLSSMIKPPTVLPHESSFCPMYPSCKSLSSHLGYWVNCCGISSICVQVTLTFGEDNGTPLQYSCLENSMDGGAWKAAVHGVAEGRTRLSDFTLTFQFHALEKEMATHSSVLAWRIPGTGEPGGLPSVGSHRVGHDWRDLAAAATPTLLNSGCKVQE